MGSESLRATLPYPPTVNHYWRHAVRKGRVCVYVSDEGKAYRQRVRAILGGAPKLTGRLLMAVRVCPPDRRARDIDNLCKCLLDSLTASGIWDDDSQIDELLIVRDKPTRGGMVEIIARESAAQNRSQGRRIVVNSSTENEKDESRSTSMFWWLYPQGQWG
ncbi:MAG: RusA family crossover junction endodeoxyribonuclease [Betaproteobacteria bacterium]|jgi:crossover junction endodeoxyribonuclease RusA|nr:RusA family crossover junction endodeoxyribonuclease [Betaproteobacteria bacterium]